MSISLTDQLKCVQRELALRKSAYPKFVASGRMKKAMADHEIEAMAAVVETILTLVDQHNDDPRVAAARDYSPYDLSDKNHPTNKR